MLINKISWGAVLAGVVVALVTQLVLNMLGIGIGAATLDPGAGAGENPSAQSFSIGAGIWFALSGIIASLAGGYAAGRLAGKPKESTAGWHGLTAWALTTLVIFYLLTSTVGGILGRRLPHPVERPRQRGADGRRDRPDGGSGRRAEHLARRRTRSPPSSSRCAARRAATTRRPCATRPSPRCARLVTGNPQQAAGSARARGPGHRPGPEHPRRAGPHPGPAVRAAVPADGRPGEAAGDAGRRHGRQGGLAGRAVRRRSGFCSGRSRPGSAGAWARSSRPSRRAWGFRPSTAARSRSGKPHHHGGELRRHAEHDRPTPRSVPEFLLPHRSSKDRSHGPANHPDALRQSLRRPEGDGRPRPGRHQPRLHPHAAGGGNDGLQAHEHHLVLRPREGRRRLLRLARRHVPAGRGPLRLRGGHEPRRRHPRRSRPTRGRSSACPRSPSATAPSTWTSARRPGGARAGRATRAARPSTRGHVAPQRAARREGEEAIPIVEEDAAGRQAPGRGRPGDASAPTWSRRPCRSRSTFARSTSTSSAGLSTGR